MGIIKEMMAILNNKVNELLDGMSEEDFGKSIADSLSDLHADTLCLNEEDSKGCECCCKKKINQIK